MSLLDPIAVCESVLETVMTQEIVLANRTDCPADSLIGTGTMLNPYNATGSASASDPPFDKIMRTLVGAGKTVRLLPGAYYTRGLPVGGSQGWRPHIGGLRLIGSGMRNTTIIRAGTPASGDNAVIGNDHTQSGEFLDSLEVSDLTVNAGYDAAASSSRFSGIAVSGKNILVKRVRATNIGSNVSGTACFGISVARTYLGSPHAENCVVDSCVVDTASASVAGGGNPQPKVFGINLSSELEARLHRFCVVRNCFVNLGSPLTYDKEYAGIAAGGGIGTIVEFNRLIDCKYGVQLPNYFSTTDLTVRHNYVRRAMFGMELKMDTAGSGSVGRLALINNVIEWPSTAEANGPAIGLRVYAQARGSNKPFARVVIRDNVMRRWNNSTNSGQLGLWIERVEQLLADGNLVDVEIVENGVIFTNTVTSIKPLFNTKPDSTLLQAYNSDTGSKRPELATVLRDADMALFRK